MMNAFFSVTAVVVALIIILRELPRPTEPIFLTGDALSDGAIKYRLTAAGGLCAATERGGGIKTRNVTKYLLRELSRIRGKGETVCSWERTLLLNEPVLVRAAEMSGRYLRYAYMTGHIGKPRLFLFCDELVKSTDGYLSETAIADGICAFEKRTTFTVNEIFLFPAMLAFCLLGRVCLFSERARKSDIEYSRGYSDGENEQVDIGERSPDYYCGVQDGAKTDKRAVKRLVEQFFDIDEIIEARKLKTAQAAAAIERACRSLRVLLSRTGYILSAFSLNKTLSDFDGHDCRDVGKTIAELKILYGYAFAKRVKQPAAAEELVSSGKKDITAAVESGIVGFKEKLRFAVSAFFAPPTCYSNTEYVVAFTDSCAEPRYYGGDTAYGVSLIRSENVFLFCDSLGVVKLGRYSIYGDKRFGLNVYAITNEQKIELCNCGCVFTRNRAVYRAVTESLELSVELTAGDMFDNLAVRTSVINRISESVECEIGIELVFFGTEHTEGDSVENCAYAFEKDCAFGLFAARAKGSAEDNRLSLTVPTAVAGFKKYTEIALAVFSDKPDEMFRFAAFLNKDFFDRALIGSAAFMGERRDYSALAAKLMGDFDVIKGLGDVCPTVMQCDENFDCFVSKVRELRKYGLRFNAAVIDRESRPICGRGDGFTVYPKDVYSVSDGDTTEALERIAVTDGEPYEFSHNEKRFAFVMPKVIRRAKAFSDDAYGDFTADGRLICDRVDAMGKFGYLCDGEVFSEIRCGVVNCYCRGGISVSDVIVAASDGSAISLFDDCAVHFSGFGEMNGAFGRVRVFNGPARSVIFDVMLKNGSSREKTYSVMIACKPDGGLYKAVPTERGIVALSKSDGNGFALLSDGQTADSAIYKEGFFSHGHLDRVGGFRKGGVVFYPAVSAVRTVPAHGKCRALFCISFKADELVTDEITFAAADRAISESRKKYKAVSDVTLLSGDKRLNDVFAFSERRAYALGLFEKMLGGENYFEQSAEALEKAAVKRMDGRGGLFVLVCALKLFKAGDSSGAYEQIKKYVYEYATEEKADGLTSALFCAVIKRLFLGIMYCGKKARFEPSICDGAPHVEFLLSAGEQSSHIIISDEHGDGDWFLEIGRVTYQSNIIDIGAHDEPILLYKRRCGA